MTQRSGKTEPRAAPSCEKQAVNNVCVLSILYSNWLRQGHGAGCRSQPSFPKPFAQSLGLSKGPSCKLGCRVAPPPWRLLGWLLLCGLLGVKEPLGRGVFRCWKFCDWVKQSKRERSCVCATLLYPWPSLCAFVQLYRTHSVGQWALWDRGWKVGGGWSC